MGLIGAACAGFLIAVLWMDLIFDVQVLRRRGEVPRPALDSIAAYYHRATTTSRPMSYLIATVMLILLSVLGFRWTAGFDPLLTLATVLAGVPILLALTHTLPAAIRLGGGIDDPSGQSRLARAICRDHLFSLASMSGFLAVWLAM